MAVISREFRTFALYNPPEIPYSISVVNESVQSSISWAKRFLPFSTIFILAFAGYILLVGDNSLVMRMKYEHTIDSLRMELEAQRDTMLYFRRLNGNITRDADAMEHVVREQYNMKRDNEEVFVFDGETKDTKR